MLRPAAFMENCYIPAVEKAPLKGRLVDAVRAGNPYQIIATDDIGKFAALVFEQPDCGRPATSASYVPRWPPARPPGPAESHSRSGDEHHAPQKHRARRTGLSAHADFGE